MPNLANKNSWGVNMTKASSCHNFNIQKTWRWGIYTLPETSSSPLNMNGWNTNFLLGWPIFRHMLVSGSVVATSYAKQSPHRQRCFEVDWIIWFAVLFKPRCTCVSAHRNRNILPAAFLGEGSSWKASRGWTLVDTVMLRTCFLPNIFWYNSANIIC